MIIDVKKGTIEVIPKTKKGNPISVACRTFMYPKDKWVFQLKRLELLNICFIHGTEFYQCRDLVDEIDVMLVPDPVNVKEMDIIN